MRYETVVHRVGEYLGPVDWSFDFAGFISKERDHEERVRIAVERLRRIAAEPDRWEATTDGGWPRVGWQSVIEVGMYDGWPYWRPIPSVLLAGVLGPTWHDFSSITNIEHKDTGERI
jgi:hypothetical protein